MHEYRSALHVQGNNPWREAGSPQVVQQNGIQHPMGARLQCGIREASGQLNDVVRCDGNTTTAQQPATVNPNAATSTTSAQNCQVPWCLTQQVAQLGCTATSISAPRPSHPHPQHVSTARAPHRLAPCTMNASGQNPAHVGWPVQQTCHQQLHQAQMRAQQQMHMPQQGQQRHGAGPACGGYVSGSGTVQQVNTHAQAFNNLAACRPLGHDSSTANAQAASAPAVLTAHTMTMHMPAQATSHHGSFPAHQASSHVAGHKFNMMHARPAAHPQNYSAPSHTPSVAMQMACTNGMWRPPQHQPGAPLSALNMLAPKHGSLPLQNGVPNAQHARLMPPHSQHSQPSQMPCGTQPPINGSCSQPTSERPYDTCPGVFKHCGGELQLMRMRDDPDMWVCQACNHMFCGVAQDNEVKLALELIEVHVPAGQSESATPDDRVAGSGALAREAGSASHPSAVPAAADTAQRTVKGDTAAASHSNSDNLPRKEVQVVVRPVAQSRQAARYEGGVLQAISRRQHQMVLTALRSSPEEAVFPLDHLPTLRHVLNRLKLLDPQQSDIPEWIERSFRRQMPRATQEQVDDAIARMPETLKQGLMEFQWEGVKFGLHRNTRCLIGDEMGVGKTVQAIALAACHMHEWNPLLVICPASLRLLWCEELEKWLPGVRPCDITIVQGSADWHPDQMESAFTATKAPAYETCNEGCTANDVQGASNAPQRESQPDAVHLDAPSDRDVQMEDGEGASKAAPEACNTVFGSEPKTQQGPSTLSTSGYAPGASQAVSQAHQQVPRHESQDNASLEHADISQRNPTCDSQQHGDGEGSTGQRKSPKVIIISYHMATNLSCAACRGSNQNHKPGKAGSGKGITECTGFPHCVAAGVYPFVIVDESHHMRTQSGVTDNQMTEVAKRIVQNSGRAVLLSGTPSVSRPFDLAGQLYCLHPGLLGAAGGFANFKTSFAFRYCQRRIIQTRARGGAPARKVWWQAGAERLHELASVLRRDFMIRRLKVDVLPQLPAKRRQVLRLERPSPTDFKEAEQAAWQAWQDEQKDDLSTPDNDGAFQLPEASGEGAELENPAGMASEEDVSDSDMQAFKKGKAQKGLFRMRGEPRTSEDDNRPVTTPQHILGLAKVRQVKEFLFAMMLSPKDDEGTSQGSQQTAVPEAPCNGPVPGTSQKFVLFAHHKSVMNLLQIMLEEHFKKKGASSSSTVPYVRIDGTTDHKSRQDLQKRFHEDSNCNVALLSMNATAVGLDFSCATAVVFTEVPDTADILLQAEGRAHRMTSKSAVNVYVLLCKATRDVRTWCRLAESLERQAPLLDSGRKSIPTTAPKENGRERGAQDATHVHDEGAGQGAVDAVKYEDVQADVRAAKAAARADASGCTRWHGGAERGKKALHVDDVMDLSEALQRQRDAALAPECDPPSATDGRRPGSTADGCEEAQVIDGKAESQMKDMPAAPDGRCCTENGTDRDAEAEVYNECRLQDGSMVVPDTDDDDDEGCGDGDNGVPYLAPWQPINNCSDSSAPATGEPVATQAKLKAFCSWEDANASSMQHECSVQQMKAPATDVAALQAVVPQQSAAAATDSAAPGASTSAAKEDRAPVHAGAGADIQPVDVSRAEVHGAFSAATDVRSLDAAEALESVEERISDNPALKDSMQTSHCDTLAAMCPALDSDVHSKPSSMCDELPDWVDEPLDEPLYDTSSAEDHKEDHNAEMQGICEQHISEHERKQSAEDEQQGAVPDNGPDLDASTVYFMVNQHTENVTLLLGQDGEVALGLRMPLSALQPKTAGANERHVQHLHSMLQSLTKPCDGGKPVLRLPWGGMLCPSIHLSATALESILRRAVMFGVAWGALSAMEKHQMGTGVLDVGEATGVSLVASCDVGGGATQQEAEESFLRSIDKRNVRIKPDSLKGEHWRPVAVTVPTSNGAKRMAVDQPFTCTNPKHLCISEQQWCCAGKRHCCNCNKLLTNTSKSGSASACKPKSAGGGSAKANETSSIGTQIKDGSEKKRAKKRIFASLAAAVDPDDESKEGVVDCSADDDGNQHATGEGSSDATAAVQGQPSASNIVQEVDREAIQEVEEVASMLLLFCSPKCGSYTTWCQNDYMLLKSNSAIRRQLYAIERGRCMACSLDTEGLLTRLKCLPGNLGGIERRLQMIFDTAPAWNRNQKRRDAARRLARHPVPGNAWQADHIKAVHLGGGLCDITNFRTLCTCCHADVTAKQARDRAKHIDAGNNRSIPDMFQSVRDSEVSAAKDGLVKPPLPKKGRRVRQDKKLGSKEAKALAKYLDAKKESLWKHMKPS